MIRDRQGGWGLGTGGSRRGSIYVYLSLLAVVVLFFHKPLFSAEYTFPWDFRGVQLPLITFLRDQLRSKPLRTLESVQLLRLSDLREHPGVLLSSAGVLKRIDQQPAVLV